MKFRVFVTAAVLACLAATAVADLSRDFIAFGQGPLQFLLTKEEAAQWKTLTTDAEAKAFVDLFWARRDPTPDTPRNEYREEIEARIAYADKTFNKEKTVGSMSDRGRTLIVFGAPKRVDRTSLGQSRTSTMSVESSLQRDQRAVEGVQQWTYEADETKAVFGIPRVEIRFLDRSGRGEDFGLEPNRVDLVKARERAVARTIVQPALTAAPLFAAAPQSEPAAAPQPAVVVTELTTDAFKTAIAEAKYSGGATWGEFVTSFGEYFVPVGLYIPKSSGATASEATFFGVVKDASGRNVLAFEEPVTLVATKDDFFADKSIVLPAGKYRGTFGVAQGGKVLALAATDMEPTGTLDKDATAVSRLILSNNVFPLSAAQSPTDPFAFGGLKVVPKADATFNTSDELWYFIELRNPGLSEPALPEGTVPVNPADVLRVPKIQVKLDVAGTTAEGKPVKMAAPPREVEAMELKGVPGHFGLGNAMPPNTFKPGEYTFTVKVIDTVKKTSYTLSEKFKVVG